MQVINASFSWEVDQEMGHSTILFPTLAAARKRAKELMQFAIEEHIEQAKKYDLEPDDLELSVVFSRITVTPITRESFCEIINSSGGRYVRDSTPAGRLEKKWSAK